METYTRQYLKSELAKRNLPCSTPTLNKFERSGVIPMPSRIQFMSRTARVYTKQEIDLIISRIDAYENAKKKKVEL